jgi:hypothetical protein
MQNQFIVQKALKIFKVKNLRYFHTLSYIMHTLGIKRVQERTFRSNFSKLFFDF